MDPILEQALAAALQSQPRESETVEELLARAKKIAEFLRGGSTVGKQ